MYTVLKKVVLFFAKAAVFCLIVLVVLEVGLRLLPARITTPLTAFFPVQTLYSSKWGLPHRIFKPGSRSTLQYQFGDLGSSTKDKAIDAEPRTLHYTIDHYGFRNDHEYRPGDVVLVGDSYIAGDANDQPDMLGSELEKRGVRSYSVAFPGGDPADYLIDLNQFYPKLKDSKVIVFFFEGNDFPLALNVWNQESALSRFKKSFQRAIGDFYTFRFGYVNYIRLRYALSHTQSQKATTVDIHGEKMGFSPDYVAVTKRETYAPPANFIDLYKKNSNKISAIVFIPEKYRVYADIGAVAGPEHLPNAQWDFTKKLGEQAHIPVYNLTTSLEAEARKQLSEQKFLWWKDDTHWNRTGIAAAATELQTIIPTLKSVQ